MANAPVQQSKPEDLNRGNLYLQNSNVETLDDDKTIENDDADLQVLDPDGSGRTVTLPEDENGLRYWIVNDADGAEDLTVNDSDDNEIDTVQQDESALFRNTGSGWVVLVSSSASGGQNV